MAGRHSIATRRRARVLEMADVRSHVIHLLTPDALNAGKQTPSDYIAICGGTVIPAPTGEPGSSYCQSCRQAIPIQRGRDAR